MHYNGMPVVILPEPAPGRHELRSWRERWLSRPWQPLLYWRWVPPEPRLFAVGQVMLVNRTIHCYRSDWDKLRAAATTPADVLLELANR